jgi:hypothetical protein
MYPSPKLADEASIRIAMISTSRGTRLARLLHFSLASDIVIE